MSTSEEYEQYREPIVVPERKNKLVDLMAAVTTIIVLGLLALSFISLSQTNATQDSATAVQEGNEIIACRAELRTGIDLAGAEMNQQIANLLVASTINQQAIIGDGTPPVPVDELQAMQESVVAASLDVAAAAETYAEGNRALLTQPVESVCPDQVSTTSGHQGGQGQGGQGQGPQQGQP